jgi:hypothetical protein
MNDTAAILQAARDGDMPILMRGKGIVELYENRFHIAGKVFSANGMSSESTKNVGFTSSSLKTEMAW